MSTKSRIKELSPIQSPIRTPLRQIFNTIVIWLTFKIFWKLNHMIHITLLFLIQRCFFLVGLLRMFEQKPSDWARSEDPEALSAAKHSRWRNEKWRRKLFIRERPAKCRVEPRFFAIARCMRYSYKIWQWDHLFFLLLGLGPNIASKLFVGS